MHISCHRHCTPILSTPSDAQLLGDHIKVKILPRFSKISTTFKSFCPKHTIYGTLKVIDIFSMEITLNLLYFIPDKVQITTTLPEPKVFPDWTKYKVPWICTACILIKCPTLAVVLFLCFLSFYHVHYIYIQFPHFLEHGRLADATFSGIIETVWGQLQSPDEIWSYN